MKLNVIISRPLEKLESVAQLLPKNRFNLFECPLIDIHPVEKTQAHLDAFSRINQYEYLVFTSQYSVIESFNYLKSLNIDPKEYKSLKICAVGPMVSQQLIKFGAVASIIPQQYTAQSLANIFPRARTGGLKVLFPKGNRSPGMLETALTKKGYSVTSLVVYTTELRTSLESNIEEMIRSKRVNCIGFTSPSSVIALVSMLGSEQAKQLLEKVAIATIGPSTLKACTDSGLKVTLCPTEYTVQGMMRAIQNFYS